ncbi:MAG TPA: accessory regulator AgrB [Mollicutes bacterium]|nr:accessory regulator AgrB [Mollicutes bacterium]
MKNAVINKLLMVIEKNDNSYNNIHIEKISYGLEAIYLLLGKTILFVTVSFFLNLLKEFLLLTIIFSGIRLYAFGLHAPNSRICLFLSGSVFIFTSYLASVLVINLFIKILIFIICFIIIILYAPADTHKRPLINKKRRKKYKLLSSLTAIFYGLLSFFISNNLVSNCLIFSLVIESLLIIPISYRLLNLPYNNYKSYHQKK